jgi:putative glutamine amidotransferase
MERFTIGISSGILHADRNRSLFDGRELHFVEWSMSDWIARSGAVAVGFPYPESADEDYWRALVRSVDGIVLHGGADVAPETYGQTPLRPEWGGDAKRDAAEIAIVKAAMAENVPLLGVCRGHQVVNVALGGTLLQDIGELVPNALEHRNPTIYAANRHAITIAPDSHLERIYEGKHSGLVNSVHHQAIDELGDGLVVEARSSEDDVVEAVRLVAESDSDPWVLGVQWHPEFQVLGRDDDLLDPLVLLEELYDAIRRRRS